MGRSEPSGGGPAGVVLCLCAHLVAGGCGDGPTRTEEPAAGPCGPVPSGVASQSIGVFDTLAAAAERRLVLMGGSLEVDRATLAFLTGALGGDVVTLRASGSTSSYNAYFTQELDPDPRPGSVTTMRTDRATAGASPFVLCHVDGTEALWLAGGDQWDYLGLWPDTLHRALAAAAARGIVMGGTSAGAVAFGGVAFDARNGTVTSDEALAEPTSNLVSVSLSPFAAPELDGYVVDSHFSQRDREGRLLAFLARARQLLGRDTVFGLGLDERAAVVIAGGAFRVLADPGRLVFLYRVTGPATLEHGQPLELDGILRASLSDGAEGSWPADPMAFGGGSLRVVGGTIGPGA